jgi:hypothetical protein
MRKPGKAAVEHQRTTQLRVCCSEQSRQRASLRYAKQRGLLYANGFHNRSQVVHALIETGKVSDRIRHAGPALVEHHYPSVAGHAK